MKSSAQLKDVTLKIGSGSTPRGGKGSYLSSGEINLIRSQNIYNHKFKRDGLAFISAEQAEKLKNVEVFENDILINITGDSIARNMVAYSDMLPARVNQHVSIIRCDTAQLDPYYLSAILTSQKMQNYLISIGQVGATRAALTKKMLEDIEIPICSIEMQREIGLFFKMLNEKIMLNVKIIETLEETVASLFENWFVHFEFPDEDRNPYKSSGGKMVGSELGEIPEGWIVGNLEMLVSTTLSGDWGKADKQGNYIKEVTVVRGADIPELRIGENGNMPKRFILQNNFDKKNIKENDIVIEISGGSPTQSTGRSLHVTSNLLKRISGDLICTNFCRIIRLKDEYSSFYFSKLFDFLYQMNVFFNYENGTTGIKNLDYKSVLENLPMKICTDKKLIRHFYDLNLKTDEYKQSLAKQNKNLEQTRDTLLPKLLSGEIELPIDEEV